MVSTSMHNKPFESSASRGYKPKTKKQSSWQRAFSYEGYWLFWGFFWPGNILDTSHYSPDVFPAFQFRVDSFSRGQKTSQVSTETLLQISFCFGFSEYQHFHHCFPMQCSKSCIKIPEMETGPLLPVFYRVRSVNPFPWGTKWKKPLNIFFLSHCNRVEHNLCVFLPNQTEWQNMATFSKTPPSFWKVVNLLWHSWARTWRSLQETSHGGEVPFSFRVLPLQSIKMTKKSLYITPTVLTC